MNATLANNTDASRLTVANNNFGFRLLSQLFKQDADKNVFISSLSVAIALAMTYNGAEGKTKQALAETLGLTGLSLEQINAVNAAFLSLLDGLDPKVQLAIANSIWTLNGIQLAPDFIQRIENYYAAKIANLDFGNPQAADIINKWVADKTNDKITKLVTSADIQLAEVILINAIYFRGIWTYQFDKGKTEEKAFTLLDGSRKRHPMMMQSGEYDYYENEQFQAVSLPYGERRISMYIFLPKPATPIREFQDSLTINNWQGWMTQFNKVKGDIVLPRFKVEYGADVLPILTMLGGVEFAGEDFLGMGAGPLIINKVIHKTFVEVNEEGAEAAAATAVTMTRGAMFDKFRMVVERPFFCAIRDNKTGALLFMGFVIQPN